MDKLLKCGLKSNIFVPSIKHIRYANSLAHSKGPILKDEPLDLDKEIDVQIDKNIISKLEKISLVDFDNEGGVQKLKASIRFAQKLRDLEISPSIKPLYTVLENEKLYLREDKVLEGDCRKQILKNAAILEDIYFVVPFSNTPQQE